MSSMIGQQGLRGASSAPTGNKLAGYDISKLQNFTPQQMQLFESLFSQVSPDSYTGRLSRGDESLFNEMEAPALKQFNSLQGNIASRFSGMGTGGRHSSGFQNTMSQASSDFAQDLQSRRQELMRQAIKDLMGMSSELLGQQPYEQFLVPKKKSFLEELFGGLSGGFGNALGMGAGKLLGF